MYFADAITVNKPSDLRKGRPHGSKNRATESIRWGIIEAYRQLGGVDGLVQWGKDNPDAFYPMLTKLLPAELAESGAGQSITVIVQRSQKPLELPTQGDPPAFEAGPGVE